MKKCKLCKKEKSISDFYKDKRLKTGYMCVCKECNLKRQKKYRTKEVLKKYNKSAYFKRKESPEKWSKFLKQERDRYAKNGRKKYLNICIICKSEFMSVRKDRRFCSHECVSGGENNGMWKGGRQINKSGYINIWKPEHIKSNKNGTIQEHRLIMENKICRFLLKKEVVHHINENKHDNRIENLMLFKNTGEHTSYHMRKKHDIITRQ